MGSGFLFFDLLLLALHAIRSHFQPETGRLSISFLYFFSLFVSPWGFFQESGGSTDTLFILYLLGLYSLGSVEKRGICVKNGASDA